RLPCSVRGLARARARLPRIRARALDRARLSPPLLPGLPVGLLRFLEAEFGWLKVLTLDGGLALSLFVLSRLKGLRRETQVPFLFCLLPGSAGRAPSLFDVGEIALQRGEALALRGVSCRARRQRRPLGLMVSGLCCSEESLSPLEGLLLGCLIRVTLRRISLRPEPLGELRSFD